VGGNNQDKILYEFSMVHCSNLGFLYIFFHFSFIYARILIYFQLIAHLIVNVYYYLCNMFSRILIAILKVAVDTKWHLMLKLVVHCT